MLRLWSKNISVGLFPNQCWLRVGRGAVVGSAQTDSTDADSMLRTFDAMLAQHAAKAGRDCRLTLTVSDSLAAIVSLPWRDALSGPAEFDAYAYACFEQSGNPLDDRWAMRSDFRHYRAMGLAYALPTAWLDELDMIVRAHGMRLDSVLPISATAFGGHRRPSAPDTTVLLLREAGRTSALVYGASRLMDYAIEPTTRSSPESATRLLRRLAGAHEIASVGDWSPHASDELDWAALLARCVPQATYVRLPCDAWS